MQTKDQYGFYRVGDLKFYSKMEAIEMQEKTGIHLHWDFNERVYQSVDWKVEPSKTLDELYKIRAQQIREQYDYVVLWYSSGADSDCVLHAFLDNDIPLNEVASFVDYNGSNSKTNIFNSEIFNIAMPKIERYQEKYPDLKHRVIDVCQPIIDLFSDPSFKFDWKYSQNSIFSPNSTIRSRLRHTVNDWKTLIDKGKKVCFVWGTDKPRISIDKGKYCFRFIDIVDNAMNPIQQISPVPGEFDEFFFWSPDLPELVIKQAHVVKRYLKNATQQSMFMTKSPTGLGYSIVNGEKIYISTVGIHYLIYPSYEYHIENETKPRSIFWSGRDTWFRRLTDANLAHSAWKQSLDNMWNSTPDYWKNDPGDPTKAFKQCLSPPYYLE